MKAKIKAGNRFDSLRDFVNRVDELGDCKKIDGADWDLEIGVIGELQSAIPNSPLLLFDRIKGYPAGFRVATNIYASNRRTALAYGLAPDVQRIELVRALRDKFRAGPKLIPSVEVKNAPVKENVYLGDDVDLFMFPTPKWHEFDGGRYIGTGSITITRDPDEGWVNMGTYRVQIHDKNTATVMISPGHHGGIMRQKYWDKGQSCPAVVTCGQEPMLFAASHFEVP